MTRLHEKLVEKLVALHGDQRVFSVVVKRPDGMFVDLNDPRWIALEGKCVIKVLDLLNSSGDSIQIPSPAEIESLRRPVCEKCEHYLKASDECGYLKADNRKGRLRGGKGLRYYAQKCPLPKPKWVQVAIVRKSLKPACKAS